jgi:hypothetical protein
MQYQQTREIEKLKRSLLNDFIDRINQRNTLILLRLQIVQSYLSLTDILHQFPLTRQSHFMWSKTNPPTLSSSSSSSTIETGESTATSAVPTEVVTKNGYQYQPKKLVDENGIDLVNLWYIPSFIEQLTLFKNLKLDMNELQKRLKYVLRIVSSFNDLIHIIVGYAQLNAIAANAEQRCKDYFYYIKIQLIHSFSF